jgi:hypothetical protein
MEIIENGDNNQSKWPVGRAAGHLIKKRSHDRSGRGLEA